MKHIKCRPEWMGYESCDIEPTVVFVYASDWDDYGNETGVTTDFYCAGHIVGAMHEAQASGVEWVETAELKEGTDHRKRHEFYDN